MSAYGNIQGVKRHENMAAVLSQHLIVLEWRLLDGHIYKFIAKLQFVFEYVDATCQLKHPRRREGG